MKIGILTQPFLRNYGGILQNWALQRVLYQLGHEPLTLEHDTCYNRTRWLLRSVKAIARQQSFQHLPEYPYKGRIGHHPFIDFIVNRIHSTTISHFTKNLDKRLHCHAFIVGSDQVWRPVFNQGRLHHMFLDFVSDETKKVAYAASFGVDNWEYDEDETAMCSALAKRFEAISVREDSGIDLCRQQLGIEASWVSDPVLLLDREDYMALCDHIPLYKDFVLIYALHLSDQYVGLANRLAQQFACQVKVMEAGHHLLPDDSLEQWLASFRDAVAVVTDSFHGMALSIVFNKPFFAFSNITGGQQRIDSLFYQYGLCRQTANDHDSILNMDIDWNNVNKKREDMKSVSLKFLTDALT